MKNKDLNIINNCWNWKGSIDKDGYGKYRGFGSHRIVWYFSRKKDPPIDRNIIRHTCDNRLCVNPFHLRCGTYQDNSNDMVSRGRSLYGEKHIDGKLKDDDIKTILNAIYFGKTIKDLAIQYQVTEPTIECIAKGKIWKHIFKFLEPQHIQQIENNLKKNQLRNKITEIEVRKIRELYQTGNYTKTDLMVMFNLSGLTTISNIINYKSWKNI